MLLVGQRGIEIYPIMRLITIPCSFFSAALFFGGCSDSQRPKGANELLDDEIRGRVVSVDLNKSLVSVEVIGTGQMLDDQFSQNANNLGTFHAQPGDLSLMAIAWNFRDDYNKGGFKLHHLGDDTGYLLSRKSLLYTFFLTALVFSPFFVESSQKVPGMFYLVSASILSLYLLLPAVSFFSSKNRDKSARKLFFVTIIYLPLLLATLVIDRYL